MSIVGIRPDIINMCMIVEELDRRKIPNVLVHAGQHYSFFFDKLFFRELGLRKPDWHLGIESGSHGLQTGRLLARSEKVMLAEKPDLVFSFSDANTSLAALAATKLHLKVGHLEAGMRSNDWRMPEEKNRRIVDHISDYLFPPTKIAYRNLIREGISRSRTFLVGKIIADVVNRFAPQIRRSRILEKLGLSRKEYFVATAHRPENVDDPKTMASILKAMQMTYDCLEKEIVYPIHPRTRSSVRRFGLKIPAGIRLTEPLGFFDFAKLESQALCLMTDSGTVQEEGCIFRVPCVTMRISTERQETVEVGSNVVAGLDSKRIFDSVKKMIDTAKEWANPYPVGATRKIVDTALERESDIVTRRVWA